MKRGSRVMKKRNALTLVEVLVIIVVVAFIVLFVAICMLKLNHSRKRELGRRAMCLGNLKYLALAWVMYADDNDGRLVNGAAGISRPNEPVWVGKDWADDYKARIQLAVEKQEEAIVSGALWPYCRNANIYHCPMALKGHIRTYSIVDSLNGIPQPGNPMGRGPTWVLDKMISKNRGQVRSPDTKAVFICVGWTAPGSYGVYYNKEKWWDPPPVRHRDGVTVSFADAHAEYWKWKGKETIRLGKIADPTQLRQHVEPKTVEGKEDLQKMQRAVWGELGYNPSVSD
jgi:prepilin-type processing-associated H-X9-DG protein